MITAEFKGLSDIQKQLNLLGKRVENRELGSALRDGAKILQREAKSKAPVNEGRLRRSIKYRILPARRKHLRMAVIGASPGKSRDDKAGAWYAHFVEKGTRFMSARPFLRPAMDMKWRAALDAVAERIKAAIHK